MSAAVSALRAAFDGADDLMKEEAEKRAEERREIDRRTNECSSSLDVVRDQFPEWVESVVCGGAVLGEYWRLTTTREAAAIKVGERAPNRWGDDRKGLREVLLEVEGVSQCFFVDDALGLQPLLPPDELTRVLREADAAVRVAIAEANIVQRQREQRIADFERQWRRELTD